MATSSSKQLLKKNLIQIAGIIDAKEAAMLVETGVDYLGFPLRLRIHKEDLSETDAARIIRSLPPNCHAVVITYLTDPCEMVDFCNQLGTGIVQLHGSISMDQLRTLRSFAPDLAIVKSLVVRKGNATELTDLVRQMSPLVDAFLTDTFDPSTGASGATGKTHDWSVSRKVVEISPRPVILAGGLNPENVGEAILEVRPAGVDSHTGVEGPDGRKSRDLVRRFIENAKEGFALMRAR